MPSMNPDGYSISSPGCSTFGGLGGLFGFRGRSGRNNGNNVDLNRDFPKQFDERFMFRMVIICMASQGSGPQAWEAYPASLGCDQQSEP